MAIGLDSAIKRLFNKYEGKSKLSTALKKKRKTKGKKSVLHNRQPSNETRFHAENYNWRDGIPYGAEDGGDLGVVHYASSLSKRREAKEAVKRISKKKKAGKNTSIVSQHLGVYDDGGGGDLINKRLRVPSKSKKLNPLLKRQKELFSLDKELRQRRKTVRTSIEKDRINKHLNLIYKKESIIREKIKRLKATEKETNYALNDYVEKHRK